jgi:hypothetical protein
MRSVCGVITLWYTYLQGKVKKVKAILIHLKCLVDDTEKDFK